MGDQEVDPTRLNMASVTDPDGGEDRHKDEGDSRQHDQGGVPDTGLGDNPTGTKEYDDAKNVDET